jgi:hypothetical protein
LAPLAVFLAELGQLRPVPFTSLETVFALRCVSCGAQNGKTRLSPGISDS